MSSPASRARFAVFSALMAGLVAFAIFSCSSDPPGPLGSDSDLLGSRPGEVVQDTLGVFDDAAYAFNTPIATAASLETGMDSLYARTMVLQPGFAELDEHPGDRNRVVDTAILHLSTNSLGTTSYPARFYRLGRKYTEGDTISLAAALPDSMLLPDQKGSVERALEIATQVYPIPAATAQEWIRDPNKREAIAVVYTGIDDRPVGSIPSQDAASGKPYLQVVFTDGVSRSYDIRDDCTVYRPLTTTSNLVVSDGYARRVYVQAELDSLAKDASVHTAHMRFHIVPETLVGKNSTLLLYIPDSTDVTTPEFKTGQRITEQPIPTDRDFIDFPLTNALFLILQDKLKDTGFAIRFKDETTQLRQVELYGSDAPESLRPRVYATVSSPAVFE